MRASKGKHSKLILYFLFISLMCAVPAMAKDKEYPPTPPPKKAEPVIMDVKPLTDKPPVHPPLKTEPEQTVSPGAMRTKPPTNPPEAGSERGRKFSKKRNLPPAGSRIITLKHPERKKEISGDPIQQPGVLAPQAVKPKSAISKPTRTKQSGKEQHRKKMDENPQAK
jgi:hypothetical protein